MFFYVNPCEDRHELQNNSQTYLNTTGSHHGDLISRIGDQSNPLQCHSIGAPPSGSLRYLQRTQQEHLITFRTTHVTLVWVHGPVGHHLCQRSGLSSLTTPGWSIANMESIFNNRYPTQCKLANPLFELRSLLFFPVLLPGSIVNSKDDAVTSISGPGNSLKFLASRTAGTLFVF